MVIDFPCELEMAALSQEIVEAAALGDVATVSAWDGPINARASHPDLPSGTTLLMAASSCGQADIVSMLLARNANVNLHAQGGVTACAQAALQLEQVEDGGDAQVDDLAFKVFASLGDPENVAVDRPSEVIIVA